MFQVGPGQQENISYQAISKLKETLWAQKKPERARKLELNPKSKTQKQENKLRLSWAKLS